VLLPDGDVKWLYCSYIRGHLDALLASGHRQVDFEQADAYPARINWTWVASLVVLIASVAVFILRPIPGPQARENRRVISMPASRHDI
jgi:hypothetical protein